MYLVFFTEKVNSTASTLNHSTLLVNAVVTLILGFFF